VPVCVGVPVRVTVELALAVAEGEAVGVKERVGVRENVAVGVRVAVPVKDDVGVLDDVAVGVRVLVAEDVGVAVGERVAVPVAVEERVAVLVTVDVPVGVGLGVGVAPTSTSVSLVSHAMVPPPSRSNKHAKTLADPQATFAKRTVPEPFATPRKVRSASLTLLPGIGFGQATAIQIFPGSDRFACARHPEPLNTGSVSTASRFGSYAIPKLYPTISDGSSMRSSKVTEAPTFTATAAGCRLALRTCAKAAFAATLLCTNAQITAQAKNSAQRSTRDAPFAPSSMPRRPRPERIHRCHSAHFPRGSHARKPKSARTPRKPRRFLHKSPDSRSFQRPTHHPPEHSGRLSELTPLRLLVRGPNGAGTIPKREPSYRSSANLRGPVATAPQEWAAEYGSAYAYASR